MTFRFSERIFDAAFIFRFSFCNVKRFAECRTAARSTEEQNHVDFFIRQMMVPVDWCNARQIG
jgi:hypothetical protein